MVSLETAQAASRSIETTSSPRISFSADFLDEKNFISISPNSQREKQDHVTEKEKVRNAEFEFLSSNLTSQNMLTADELFFEEGVDDLGEANNKEEARMSWFLDDDPSPRPPKCTVLWKELLRLKKQRASSLSPSSSTSSSSSSSGSIADMHATDEGKDGAGHREKYVKRIKKGLERTRSASLRIRPMVNVPICTQGKNNALPPLFSLKERKIREVKTGR